MSAISEIFDTLKASITEVLPEHMWLSDPRLIESNSELDLNKGVGIALGAGEAIQREIDKHIWISREVSVTITRRHFASELNREDQENEEKNLLEDQKLLIVKFMNDPLDEVAKSVSKALFLGDNGIENVFGDSGSFLKITTRFQVQYREIIQ